MQNHMRYRKYWMKSNDDVYWEKKQGGAALY